jgi:hypothetical protein
MEKQLGSGIIHGRPRILTEKDYAKISILFIAVIDSVSYQRALLLLLVKF